MLMPFCFFFSTACQSSTDRKGGQAVPSLCNQCWGFCGGPTAIPDYSQNVRTLFYCGVKRVEEVDVDDYSYELVVLCCLLLGRLNLDDPHKPN